MAVLGADADFGCDEDLGQRFFENRPEYGHRSTHDGEVYFKTREHDGDGRPPGEIDVWVCRGTVDNDAVETPD